MDVEVDLYSGRPNPRARLDPAVAAELVRRIGTLSAAGGAGAPREGLGYRGLRIEGDPSFAEIFVSGGQVLVREHAGRERRLADPGRALERWLADAVGPALDPDVAAVMRNGLRD